MGINLAQYEQVNTLLNLCDIYMPSKKKAIYSIEIYLSQVGFPYHSHNTPNTNEGLRRISRLSVF